MRKVIALVAAVGASFALAASASAASITIVGSSAPGTNTYDIVLSFSTGELVSGFATSTLLVGGVYTGAFTETIPGAFSIGLPGPTVPPLSTGIVGSWGGISFSPVVGGTFTIGTVTVTVAPTDTLIPFFTLADGVVTTGSGIVPTTLTGVTIIPEPTTAALLGLGIVGLVMAGRRNRA